MRINSRRVKAIVLATPIAVILAVPALAAQPDPLATQPADLFASPAKQKPAQPKPDPPPAGPFHPLVGKPDYGTADNAFGAPRTGHVHAGQDVFAPAGTPLVAVSDGIVIDRGMDGERGNHLGIYDPKRDQTYVYMHMNAPALVDNGEHVHAGERVGAVGCTGSCWGDHVHFEIREGRDVFSDPRDPLPALRSWEQLKHPID